jgi:hypothetical protein
MKSRRLIASPEAQGKTSCGFRIAHWKRPGIRCRSLSANVRFGSKADVTLLNFDVRFTPNSGLMQCSKERRYSITSSAMESTPAGIVRPSVFAVLRLMTSSNLVDCITGRSAGFAPLRI